MRGTALLLLTLSAILHKSDELPCPKTCHRSLCSRLACPYGLGSGICNCCPRCLKGPFRKCGGLWNIVGMCASGLVCTNQTSLDNDDVGICIFKPKEQPGKTYGE